MHVGVAGEGEFHAGKGSGFGVQDG
jgi:hypothetical protein